MVYLAEIPNSKEEGDSELAVKDFQEETVFEPDIFGSIYSSFRQRALGDLISESLSVLSREEKEHKLMVLFTHLPIWLRNLILLNKTKRTFEIHNFWNFYIDICNFTLISEVLTAQGKWGDELLAQLLNEFFSLIQDIAKKYGLYEVFPEGDARGLIGFALDKDQMSQFSTEIQQKVAEFSRNPLWGKIRDLIIKQRPEFADFNFKIRVGVGFAEKGFVSSIGDLNRAQGLVRSTEMAESINAIKEYPENFDAVFVGYSRKAAQMLSEDQIIKSPQEDEILNIFDYNEVSLNKLSEDELERCIYEAARYLPNRSFKNLEIEKRDSVHHECTVVCLYVSGLSYERLEDLDILNQMYTEIIDLAKSYGAMDEPLTPLVSAQQKVIGEKLFFIFGGERVHLNKESLAIQMSKGLRELCSRYGLKSFISVSSGKVCMVDVGGSNYRHFSLLGDEVNTASRISSASLEKGDFDQIKVERGAAIKVSPNVIWRKKETVPPFKGQTVDREIFTFQDFDPSDIILKPGMIPEDGIFVDREDDLTHLALSFDLSNVIWIEGERGVGKTMLLRKFLQENRLDDKFMISVIRPPVYEKRAFNEIQQWLNSIMDLIELERMRLLIEPGLMREEEIAVIKYLLNPDALALKKEPDMLQLIPSALISFLKALNRLKGKRYLLVVEDTHKLSVSSQICLMEIMGEMIQENMGKFMFTSLPERKEVSFLSYYCAPYQLAPLSDLYEGGVPNLIRKLFQQSLGTGAMPSETVFTYLKKKCKGNPNMIIETCRSLIDQKMLVQRSAHEWELHPDLARGDKDLKLGMEYFLDEIDASDDLKMILDFVAVLRGDFNLNDLIEIFELNIEPLEMERNLIRFCEEGVLRFNPQQNCYEVSSPIISELLSSRLNSELEVRLHLKAGNYFYMKNDHAKAYYHFSRVLSLRQQITDGDLFFVMFVRNAWIYAQVRIQQGDTNEVVSVLERILSLPLTSDDLAKNISVFALYFELGRHYGLQGKFEECEAFYNLCAEMELSPYEDFLLTKERLRLYKKRQSFQDQKNIISLCARKITEIEKDESYPMDIGLQSRYFLADASIMAEFSQLKIKKDFGLDDQPKEMIDKLIHREGELYRDVEVEYARSPDLIEKEYMRVCSNLAILYFEIQEYDQSLFYAEKGYEVSKSILNRGVNSAEECELVAGNLVELTKGYFRKREIDKVKEYGDLAIKLSQATSLSSLVDALIVRGEIYDLDNFGGELSYDEIKSKFDLNCRAYRASASLNYLGRSIWALANILQCLDVIIKRFKIERFRNEIGMYYEKFEEAILSYQEYIKEFFLNEVPNREFESQEIEEIFWKKFKKLRDFRTKLIEDYGF